MNIRNNTYVHPIIQQKASSLLRFFYVYAVKRY